MGMSAITETIEDAHSGAVWSLALLPDRSGFVSGSADKTVSTANQDVTLLYVTCTALILINCNPGKKTAACIGKCRRDL